MTGGPLGAVTEMVLGGIFEPAEDEKGGASDREEGGFANERARSQPSSCLELFVQSRGVPISGDSRKRREDSVNAHITE